MRVSDAFPSKYLSAADLDGGTMSMVISHVTIEKLGDDTKPVLHFQGGHKSMALNKTNATKIAELYGDEMDEWQGRELVLFCVMTEFQGKTTEGLRVRAPQPKDRPANSPSRHYTRPTTSPQAMKNHPLPSDEPPPWEPDSR